MSWCANVIIAEIAADFDQKLEQARQSSDAATIERIKRKQRINDSAYFILAWGQLEIEINHAAEEAVRTHRASIRWNERRAWDAHNPDKMKARFEDRAALVLDRANTSSDSYRKLINYYGLRNNIAHGKSLATGIDVPLTILDFYQIQGMITR